jgi:hypothetical protein
MGFDPIILAPIGFKVIDFARYVLSCQRGLVELKILQLRFFFEGFLRIKKDIYNTSHNIVIRTALFSFCSKKFVSEEVIICY